VAVVVYILLNYIKIITKELIESNKVFINNNLGLNIVLVENLIGAFTDAKILILNIGLKMLIFFF